MAHNVSRLLHSILHDLGYGPRYHDHIEVSRPETVDRSLTRCVDANDIHFVLQTRVRYISGEPYPTPSSLSFEALCHAYRYLCDNLSALGTACPKVSHLCETHPEWNWYVDIHTLSRARNTTLTRSVAY